MLKFVFQVSTFGLDASTKASVLLLDCLVNNTLVKFVPDSMVTLTFTLYTGSWITDHSL